MTAIHSLSPEERLDQAIAGLQARVIPEFPRPHVEFPDENARKQASPRSKSLASSRRHWMTTVGGLSLAGVAAMLLITTALSLWTTDSWAQVVDAIGKQAWVRLRISSPDGQAEMWFSSKKRVAAARYPGAAWFLDLERRRKQRFDQQQNTIFVSDPDAEDDDESANLTSVLQSLSSRKELPQPKTGSIKLLSQSRREGSEGDKRWTDFTFSYEDSRRSPPQFRRMFRIPAGTELPTRMTEEWAHEGKTFSRVFEMDYPESGPADLFAMDVPKDAPVVDTRSSADLKSVLAAYAKQQSAGFDEYTALSLSSAHDWKSISDAYNIRHHASGYTADVSDFEQLQKLQFRIFDENIQLPETPADRIQWWKTEVSKLAFQSFGQTDTFGPGQTFVPDLVCYPGLGFPNEGLRATLATKPVVGPSDAVLLTVENAKTGSILHRFWLAPEKGYACVRSELSSVQGYGNWIHTVVVDQAEKSPQGRWYATHVRTGVVERSGGELRTDSSLAPVATVSWRYLVDFQK